MTGSSSVGTSEQEAAKGLRDAVGRFLADRATRGDVDEAVAAWTAARNGALSCAACGHVQAEGEYIVDGMCEPCYWGARK